MSISDRLDREVEGWRPEPGDKLVGLIVGVTGGQSEYGPYPILEIENSDGKIFAAHCFHTVLRKELEGRQPTEGDQIGIKYLGKKGQGSGAYDNYRVVIERAHPRVPAPTVPPAAPPAPAAASVSPSPASPWGEEPF